MCSTRRRSWSIAGHGVQTRAGLRRGLRRVLMALVRGEGQVGRVVRVPSIVQEDERRPSRERQRLLHERNSHIACIKGLLILHGVRDYRLIERDWKERLDAVR